MQQTVRTFSRMNNLFKRKVEFEEVRLSSDEVLECHGKLNDTVILKSSVVFRGN